MATPKQKFTSAPGKLRQLHQKVKPHIDKAKALRLKRHHYIMLALSATLIGLVSGIAGYYTTRGMPGVQVAGVSINGKTKNEVRRLVEARRDAMQVTFAYNGKRITTPATKLGVTVDVNATATKAMAARRQSNLLHNLRLWQTDNISLVYNNDLGIFKDFVVTHFPEISLDAKDAEIVFNSDVQRFDVTPGSLGQGFDTKKFENLLPNLTAHPQSATLAVSGAPVAPLIERPALANLQQALNERVTLPLEFTHQGKVMYTAQPAQIAKWVNFTPDPQSGKVNATYDKAKITQFLTDTVGPAVAARPIERKIIKDPTTGQEYVLQQGQNGRSVQNIVALTDSIVTALEKKQPQRSELQIAEAPFSTTTLTGYDRWVEVDLSEQRTTLFNGSNAVASFSISSGTAASPTVTGEFRVWYKNASQTMTGGSRASGDYYYLPGVSWVTYFYKDYSFHTAYWHNNFGHPMSHGCVNMRQADAKVLYDFAPVGTKVVVHY